MKTGTTIQAVLSVGLLLMAGFHSVGYAQQSPESLRDNPNRGVRNIVLVHGAWADGSSWSGVIPLLEAHLDGKIALQQVAEACDLSVGHFARAFRQTFRRPPYKWLIERRVDRARDLMTNSRLPLADIAIQSGFADQSALNRTFKRLHGVAPGIWRRTSTRGPIGLDSSNGKGAGTFRQLPA